MCRKSLSAARNGKKRKREKKKKKLLLSIQLRPNALQPALSSMNPMATLASEEFPREIISAVRERKARLSLAWCRPARNNAAPRGMPPSGLLRAFLGYRGIPVRKTRQGRCHTISVWDTSRGTGATVWNRGVPLGVYRTPREEPEDPPTPGYSWNPRGYIPATRIVSAPGIR